MIKQALVATIFAGILIFSLIFNVCIHELGHYAVADSFGLHPSIHIYSPAQSTTLFMLNSEPIAYTSYQNISTSGQDAAIAFAGPAANALFAALIFLIYLRIPVHKRNLKLQLVFVLLIIPAIISAIGNILPLPNSDGSAMFNWFRNI